MAKSIGTLWVCVDCFMVHANGETEGTPDCEPLSCIPDGHSVTAGLLAEEHSPDCFARLGAERLPYDYECDCECDCDRQTFSSSRCDGCGSTLGGARDALTLWKD